MQCGQAQRGTVLQEEEGQPFAADPERLQFTAAILLDDPVDPLGEVLDVELEFVVQRDHREPVGRQDLPVAAELPERGFQVQLVEFGPVLAASKTRQQWLELSDPLDTTEVRSSCPTSSPLTRSE